MRMQEARESSMKRKKTAAMRFFELMWNCAAIFFVCNILRNSPFIPQHDQVAGDIIQQTKIWLSGQPDASSWQNMSTKADVVSTLNTTVLDAMHRLWQTHYVFHFNCTPERRRRLVEDQESSLVGGAPKPTNPGPVAAPKTPAPAPVLGADNPQVCEDLTTHVPHRGGVWLFAVSHDDEKNTGCTIDHDPHEEGLAIPWRSDGYEISGTITVSLLSFVAMFAHRVAWQAKWTLTSSPGSARPRPTSKSCIGATSRTASL
jgi:hypothetical protein